MAIEAASWIISLMGIDSHSDMLRLKVLCWKKWSAKEMSVAQNTLLPFKIESSFISL